MNASPYPIAIIGAGPVGLAAAAHLSAAGEQFVILEAGTSVAAGVQSWSHVRVFSPWRYNIDSVAARLLASTGWEAPPEDEYPTGGEFVRRYLAPLASLPGIAASLHLGATVTAITRAGRDKLKSAGRAETPFEIIFTAGGIETRLLARAVIDASGTIRTPNPLGGSGTPAVGEKKLADRMFYGIPDVLGAQRARYAGKRVLVVGNGHSAFNALHDLAELAPEGTTITWAIRAAATGAKYGGGDVDQLPRRGELGTRIRTLVEGGSLRVESGFSAQSVEETTGGLVVRSGDRALLPVDEIVVTTGYRPDLSITRELRLHLDDIVESPAALASLIDPNLHSCGTVPPHGAAQLQHTEPDFYTVGMKSYGRAPTFLMLTGYEQVRSVVAALTGDVAGSLDVRLVLPETGACSGPAAAAGEDKAASGCCGSAPAAAVEAEAASGCCGGPAPAGANACCALDATAKAAGEGGCGCGSTRPERDLIAIS